MTECKQCGVTDSQLFYDYRPHECKACTNERAKKQQDSNILRYRYTSARNRAKAKDIEFTITYQNVKDLWDTQNGKCYYSGTDMILIRGNDKDGSSGYSASLDRIDSNIGYTPDNTVLCMSAINIMKHTLSIDKFKHLITSLYEHMNS
jgi:hypothetical protein